MVVTYHAGHEMCYCRKDLLFFQCSLNTLIMPLVWKELCCLCGLHRLHYGAKETAKCSASEHLLIIQLE